MHAPLTPDFIPHAWLPLAAADVDRDGFVTVQWPDGTTFDAYSLWLAGNADRYGVGVEKNAAGSGRDPSGREWILEPRDLPAPASVARVAVDVDGALALD